MTCKCHGLERIYPSRAVLEPQIPLSRHDRIITIKFQLLLNTKLSRYRHLAVIIRGGSHKMGKNFSVKCEVVTSRSRGYDLDTILTGKSHKDGSMALKNQMINSGSGYAS